MLETLPILLPNLYKLMWHPKWRVLRQQLKHYINISALAFIINKIIKILRYLNMKKKKKKLIPTNSPAPTHTNPTPNSSLPSNNTNP